MFRGPGVFCGYLNKPEQTNETIIDGWLHTGDVGHLDNNGNLKITDRKKTLLLLQEEKIYHLLKLRMN